MMGALFTDFSSGRRAQLLRYKGDGVIYITSPLACVRSRRRTALGEVVSPTGRLFVDQFQPASLPPGAPATHPRSTEHDSTLEAGSVKAILARLTGACRISRRGPQGIRGPRQWLIYLQRKSR